MMLSPNPQGVLLGTRVAAPVGGDLYAAATVQAVRNDATGNEFVTVKFDDNNKSECLLSEIVGNGFKSIHDIKLHRNQKVYMTYRGREIVASVESHQNGFVRLKLPGFDKIISMREEDVRLTENRYSPRLHDHEHDYRKIVQINASPSHGKKRPVSDSIEVPNVGRPRKMSHEPTMDELMAAMVLTNLSSSPVFYNPKSPTIHKAASSPHSFGSSGVGSWGHETQMSPIRGDTQMTMGDLETTPERTRSVIHHTHSIDHSPSSTIDPIDIDTSGGLDTSVPMDESDTDVKNSGVVPPGHSTPAPFQNNSSHIQFQGSSPSHNTAFLVKPGVKLESVKEEPVDREEMKPNIGSTYGSQPRLVYIPPLLPIAHTPRGDTIVHLGPIATPPLAVPNERQFSEVGAFPRPHQLHQADVPVPPSNACVYIGSPGHALYTIPIMGSSPLNSNLTYSPAPVSKHRAPSPLAVRNDRAATSTPPYPVRPHSINRFGGRTSSAQPINIPGMKAFSWHSTGIPQSYSPKPSILMQRQHLHQAASPKMYSMSPKTMPGRKVRGDGKKCRKVYGMENKDMWCTACRWKKACQRFPD